MKYQYLSSLLKLIAKKLNLLKIGHSRFRVGRVNSVMMKKYLKEIGDKKLKKKLKKQLVIFKCVKSFSVLERIFQIISLKNKCLLKDCLVFQTFKLISKRPSFVKFQCRN